MKKLLSGLTLLLSISSFATTPQAGDTLRGSVDWERIERGLTTGDFSCRGSCAEVSIDWKETWLTITGQKYRNQKKQDIAYCITEFQKSKNTLDDVDRMEEEGTIGTSEAVILKRMHEISMRSVELVCESRLGERKTKNLKVSIFN